MANLFMRRPDPFVMRRATRAAVFLLALAGTGAWSQVSNGASTAAELQKKAEPIDRITPVRTVPDPGVIPTNQTISPAGVQSIFETRIYGVAFGDSSREVYALTGTGRIYGIDWQSNKVLEQLKAGGGTGLQGLTYDPVSKSLFVSALVKAGAELESKLSANRPGSAINFGKWSVPAQVALSPSGAIGTRYAVVALNNLDAAGIVDLGSGKVLGIVKTGIAPFGVAIDAGNETAWVSNWGGRFPRPGDQTSPAGGQKTADQVVVDARGIASTGTVSRIDLRTLTVTATIEVGLHPAALALDSARHRLYVANSNSDTVSVIDTEKNSVMESIPVQPFARDAMGVAPESLVLSRDGKHLYVACAGINAIAVYGLKSSHMKLEGLIPTGWYPDSVALSPDGKYLGVATLLGVGSGWKNSPPNLCKQGLSPRCRYVHSYRGTVHVIPVPDKAELKNYSIAVAEDNHLRLRASREEKEQTSAPAREMPVPLRAGDPSPIKHIIYVIKENNSYDTFFGSLGKGNGDPSLNLWADDVIPNHRKLARDYVLLDNFYATGGNSADGHQWLTQANETDYVYLPGYAGRSYPWGDDPIAPASGGFIWNEVLGAHKTFIDFGEFAGYGEDANDTRAGGGAKYSRQELLKDFENGSEFENMFVGHSLIASLNPYMVKEYPGWTLDVPDVARARIFQRYLRRWEAEKNMPNLVMLYLPVDHTAGASPGFSTASACIADNDYALGMVVDSVSHSSFWGSTLILVVEDDAQNGVDHVDGHRTVALAISPYIKRGSVDSTFYSHQSMLKTIELILGLKPMSIYDRIANDMRNSFQDKPDLTPYTAVKPEYSLFTVTPKLKSLNGQKKLDAEASLKMNFKMPDAVPAGKLNRILWRDVRGANAPYPKVRHAIFAPYASPNDEDDDESSK